MSVNIRFEPVGITGIVAEGTYLWDAAKRIGTRLPAECGGRGECDTCAVTIVEGATLLSSLTNAERARLSPERLAAGERLACQAKILYGGDIEVRPVPVTEREETTAETVSDFRSDFKSLPLKKKLATLVELEAHTMFETLNTMVEVPISVGEKFMNLVARKGRAMSKHDRDERRPAEHREEAGEEFEESE
ncbi:MAG TPA: 2Fe-2S iron-sulfur cluster-binding protein [Pyrinomonadaceae bacterium]|nr:2Fe-2S iron-sulfur cluster-binding protein [Pyrinomonadaceae bacterium]